MRAPEPVPKREELLSEIEELRSRLRDAEDTLQAIRQGEVDALLVEGPAGEQVFTLRGADHGYRILVETMDEGALTVLPNGVIYYANARFANFLQAPLEQIIGSSVQRFISPPELPEFEGMLHRDGQRRGEFNLVSVKDQATPVLISMNNGPDDDPLGTICLIVTDLTQQKHVLDLVRAQAVLRESELRFRTLAEAIPQLSWTTRPDGQCDYLSQQWLDYTGVPFQVQLGLGWLNYLHPDDRERTHTAWKNAFENSENYDLEFRILGKDGAYRWFKTRGIPVRDEKGKIVRWFGTCTDIEDIVKARQVLAQSREELESLVQHRTAELEETTAQLNNFCYSIAHDLRAPLRAQNAYARILLEDFGASLGETGQGFANRIINAAEKLDRLVNDLLSHVSISRGDLPVEKVDLLTVITQVRADFSEQFHQARATVTVAPLGGIVLAHEPSLNLIISNLISNALKYCKPGTLPVISIRTELRPDNFIRLWIEDEGIGIKPEYHDRIFGVFQRLHTSDVYPGTGIGLALVRKGLERMGGKVGVESEFGKGSRFWIDLPRA